MIAVPIGIMTFMFLVFVPIIPMTLGPFAKCIAGLCMAIPQNARLLPNGEYVYTVIVSFTYYLSGFGVVVNGQYSIASNGLTWGANNAILLLFLPLIVVAVGGTMLSISYYKSSDKIRTQREWLWFSVVLATVFSIFVLLDSGQWVWSWLPISGTYMRPYAEHAIGDAILALCASLAIWKARIRIKSFQRSNARLLSSLFVLLFLFWFTLIFFSGFSNYGNAAMFALTIIEYMLVVAFTEELLFRGFIQKFLERRLRSSHLIVICTAIMFAVFHLVKDVGAVSGYLILGDLLTQLIGGIVFSYIYLVTDDLAFSIIIHGFYDLSAVDVAATFLSLEMRTMSMLLVSLFLIVPLLVIGYARRSRFEEIFVGKKKTFAKP